MDTHPLVHALAVTLAATETPVARAAVIDALHAKIVTAPDTDLRRLGVSLVNLAVALDKAGARAESSRVMGLLSGLAPRLNPLVSGAADARYSEVRKNAQPKDAPSAKAALAPPGKGLKVRKN